MTIEDTIFIYYESMLQGEMKKSQELLDWDMKEASIIEYYSNLGKLHHIVSVEDFEITNLSESDGIANAEVKITNADKNGDEEIEVNKVRLRLNPSGVWLITSIK